MVSLAVVNPALRGVMAAPSHASGATKRKRRDSMPEEGDLTSSQLKRQKVDFDPDVEVRLLNQAAEKSLDLIKEEMRRAIQKHRVGDSAGYDQIKQIFKTKPSRENAPSSKLLHRYILALTGYSSMLDRRCDGLVHALLESLWLGRDAKFVSAYTHLLASILSAHAGYTSSILGMLVEYLVELPSSIGRIPELPVVPRTQLQARVHSTLKYLLHLIPSTSGVLPSILGSAFPHSSDTLRMHVDYVTNLLDIIKYAPEMKGYILALISERLVKIDVEIQVDMEDLEEDTQEALIHDVLEEHNRQKRDDQAEDEEDSSLSDDDESDDEEDELDPERKRLKLLKASVSKMDAILDLLFEFYDPEFSRDKAIGADSHFDLLLNQFTSVVLPTYRSRHTQFLMFHFGQSSPSFTERFAGTCAHITFDRNRPQLVRIAAAAYLASFIARGAHVSPSMVRNVFGILASNLDKLLILHQPKCVAPDLRRYGAYYAIAQAMLYVFCFRWRDLIDMEDDEEDGPLVDEDIFDGRDLHWTPGIKEVLTRNIYSSLNPLKVCSPAIVAQFARIANHLKFLYVFPKLETNKRVRLSRSVMTPGAAYGDLPERETALSAKVGEGNLQLDAFFPFDPYCLPKSRRWIDGDYVAWRPIPGLDDEEDEESNSGDDGKKDEGEDVEEDTETDDEAA